MQLCGWFRSKGQLQVHSGVAAQLVVSISQQLLMTKFFARTGTLLTSLQEGFSLDGSFWEETGYFDAATPFQSFFYDLVCCQLHNVLRVINPVTIFAEHCIPCVTRTFRNQAIF